MKCPNEFMLLYQPHYIYIYICLHIFKKGMLLMKNCLSVGNDWNILKGKIHFLLRIWMDGKGNTEEAKR